jgi:hypothetical protein
LKPLILLNGKCFQCFGDFCLIEFKSHRPDHSTNIENIGENQDSASCQNGAACAGDTFLTQKPAEFQPESERAVKFPREKFTLCQSVIPTGFEKLKS